MIYLKSESEQIFVHLNVDLLWRNIHLNSKPKLWLVAKKKKSMVRELSLLSLFYEADGDVFVEEPSRAESSLAWSHPGCLSTSPHGVQYLCGHQGASSSGVFHETQVHPGKVVMLDSQVKWVAWHCRAGKNSSSLGLTNFLFSFYHSLTFSAFS